jgi:hypothetical protein
MRARGDGLRVLEAAPGGRAFIIIDSVLVLEGALSFPISPTTPA